jgi:hypothetical protein
MTGRSATMTDSRAFMVAAVLAFAAAACQGSPPPAARPSPAATPAAAAAAPAPVAPPFKVATLDVGKEIGADKRVKNPTTSFAANDTIYASVASEGSTPKVALKARWTYQDGQLVDESVQTIAPTGPTVTEFHIAKPSGWPAGKYKVEISANGAVAATREFEVAG